MVEKKQTQMFGGESLRYVSSYIHRKRGKDEAINLAIKGFMTQPLKSILDVGCGNGEFLFDWKNYFGIEKAVGVEPSEDAVKLLRKKWKAEDCINFQSAFAHHLPFESDSFDLVTSWSVLHWIGRNEYLQSIGELIRVCSKYLCVMDFVAHQDYMTPYHHLNGLYTYKQDFDSVISASGIMRRIEVLRYWVDPQSNTLCMISEEDLKPFDENIVSYHARKLVVYEKDFSHLPIKTEIDFS